MILITSLVRPPGAGDTLRSREQMGQCSKAEVRLETALRWKIPAAQRQRIQMVLLRENGRTQPVLRTMSDLTGGVLVFSD